MNPRRLVTVSVPAVLLTVSLIGCGGGGGADEAAAPAPASPQTTEVTAALLDRGVVIYKANCVPCHGPTGKGDGPSAAMLDPKPRDHSNRAYMDTLTDQQIATTIVSGGAPKFPNMPSHPHIKGGDLAAIVAHVRTLSRGGDQVSVVDLPSE
jgi:mono/diheme cytochrome c family protein